MFVNARRTPTREFAIREARPRRIAASFVKKPKAQEGTQLALKSPHRGPPPGQIRGFDSKTYAELTAEVLRIDAS
jgi:hypothetical protein